MAESKRMQRVDPKKAVRASTPPPEPGWDVELLCSEAQADGVPCTEVGRACETCERAVVSKRKRS